jgi:hypothetical protein
VKGGGIWYTEGAMGLFLSTKEIGQRLVEWRNLKRLHKVQKERIKALEREDRELRARYEGETRDLRKKLETALIRIAELEEKVFGRKGKSGSSGHTGGSNHERSTLSPSKPRTPATYQRAIPEEEPT